jgi:hypothetical protein
MPWGPNPERDADGNVQPHDDPALVPDGSGLIRHVPADQWAPDERTGGFRPQSNAFTFSSTGSRSMSVDIEPPMLEAGLASPHYAFLMRKGAVRVRASKARELGMRVGSEPVPGNLHHGGIWAPNPPVSDNQLDKKRRALSRTFELVALPPAGLPEA